MNTDPSEAEERFRRIAEATDALGPSPDFTARVMAAVGTRPEPDLSTWIAKLGRLYVPVAAVLMGALAFWAIESKSDYEEAVIVASYDMEQLW